MAARKTRRGFTLVELLVVVAIIALLISILLPSLKRAREQAKETVCKTRLKNIGLAIEFYQGENKGLVPPHALPDFIWHWYLLTEYMSGQPEEPYEEFVCPSDRTRELDSFFKDQSVPQLEREQRWSFDISYGLSHVTYQDYGAGGIYGYEGIAYHPESDIKRPSDTILSTDSGDRDERHQVYLRMLPNTLWNVLHRNYEGYVVDNQHRYPSRRHHGGSSVLYLDKHVEFADFDTLIPPKETNEVYAGWYRDRAHQDALEWTAHAGGY